FLLGNTLGNFDNTGKVLSNLKLSMFSEDSLIIGNQIANLFASSKFVKYYHAKEGFNFVASTLLHYGMNCSFEEFSARWNAQQKQIEMILTLKEDKKITIADYVIHFEKGEEILLATSKKFAEESLFEEFNNVGFRVKYFTTNKKKNTCIVSVSPTRYKSQ
ncbi:MAG: L-histidine N(alpha)-methyltransferase, partial [Candidatus Levyibacteriota bacterium]